MSVIQHFTHHSKRNMYECTKCNKIFSSNLHLQEHFLIHAESKDESSTCTSFNLVNVNDTTQPNTNSSMNLLCENKDRLLNLLQNHRQWYQCKVCDMAIKSVGDLKNHITNHLDTLEELPLNIFALKNFAQGTVQCDICKAEFIKTDTLRTHLYVHMNYKPYKCNTCGKSYSKGNSLASHKHRRHSEGQSNCSYCGNSFKDKEALDEHNCGPSTSKSKSPEQPDEKKMFSCEVCGKAFMKTHNLKKHSLTHKPVENVANDQTENVARIFEKEDKKEIICSDNLNTDEKPWKCEFCGKRFVLVTKLKNHEYAHGKPIVFHCELCYKSFPELDALYDHTDSHCGENVWECTICEKSFSSKYNMNRHKALHLNPTNIAEKKVFECAICKKQYATKFSLRTHMKQHESVDHPVVLNQLHTEE